MKLLLKTRIEGLMISKIVGCYCALNYISFMIWCEIATMVSLHKSLAVLLVVVCVLFLNLLLFRKFWFWLIVNCERRGSLFVSTQPYFTTPPPSHPSSAGYEVKNVDNRALLFTKKYMLGDRFKFEFFKVILFETSKVLSHRSPKQHMHWRVGLNLFFWWRKLLDILWTSVNSE